MNKLLGMMVLVPSVICGAEGVKVSRVAILAAADLGRISVRCNDEGFQVKGPEGIQLVERGDTDETLRRINPKNIRAFSQRGRLSVSKTKDGNYILRSYIPGPGGGPITGSILYWGTKVLGYGTVAAGAGVAVGTGVAAVAGAAGLGTFVAGGAAALAAEKTAELVVAGAAVSGAGAAATVIGGGAVAIGAGGSLTTGTAVAMASTATTAGGIFGFIESLSTAALVAGTLCPFLP